MASQTTHFDMVKQQSPERVSVGLLNDNFDIIDGVMFANQEKSEQLADDYNASEIYNTGDYARRENYLYKCNTDNTTGTWDDTKWDRVKVMNEITQGGGGGSSTLAGLNDVDLSSPTDGQLLAYNATTGKWENVTGGGGGGSTTFAGLNDVNVQGVQNGDIARYNSATGKWTDSSDLTDLELSVSQLSSSVLSIAGDVDSLELTVSQMSASTLPFDANTSTKQKIDSLNAETLNYSESETIKTKIDRVDGKVIRAFSLITAQIVSTGTVNTYGGRKFSDYDFYEFLIGTLSTTDLTVRGGIQIAKSSFTSGNRPIIMNALHGSTSGQASDYRISGVTFAYNSDTSITVTLGGSQVLNAIEVIGYKLA